MALLVHGTTTPTTTPDDCDYCGSAGCHWTRHAEARADVASWEREVRAETFPFGDHRPAD